MIDAFPAARERVPNLRMIVVAGPRIDPASLPDASDGLEVRAYVHDLYQHLAACDLAVVQGGLTTAMELTANKRPFLASRCATTSSRTSTSATGSTATAPGASWTSRRDGPEQIADAIAAGDRPRRRLPRRRDRRRARARRAAIAELL